MDQNENTISWQRAIADEWNARRAKDQEKPSPLFPLAMNPFGQEEIIAMTEVLLSGRLTLDQQIEKAEKKFAQIVGVPYAVMVNSGSSANLLAVSAMTNKLRKHHCRPGDHVLVPAVSWSTSVFPLLQNGLHPVFLDAHPRTFNTTIEELERKLTPQVKAVMAVHVLGNAIDMRQLMRFVQQHQLILIEDTCESLGSFSLNTDQQDPSNPKLSQQMLGTFGDFGTFSFYFSHHITSGEGGMITCKTEDDYNLLRCLRAHGWTRHLTNRQQVEQNYPQLDSRFLFINIGYNLRPLEVQGAMINVQLDKLADFNACRRDNLERIRQALLNNPQISSVMSLMEPSSGIDPAWFGVAALLHRPYAHQKLQFLDYLEKNGIENRPIISGNFIRQPCIRAFCENEQPENYPGAEAIHMRGFFIGVHQISLHQTVIEKLVEIILGFPFYPQHVILVTGYHQMIGKYLSDYLQQQQSDSSPHPTSSSKAITTKDAEWIFVTAHDGDLRRIEDVTHLFKRYQPTRILHCALHQPSSEEIHTKPADLWLDHATLNNNILKTAFDFQTWVGPIKVLSLVSSPSSASSSNNPHLYAQQALLQLTQWYRQQYHCHFLSIVADDIFGPYHAQPSETIINHSSVHSFINMIHQQKRTDPSQPIRIHGTNTQTYHPLYARDLARILVGIMSKDDHIDDIFPIEGTPVSMSDLLQLISHQLNFSAGFSFIDDPQQNSAVPSTKDPSSLKSINHELFTLTPLETALQQTIDQILPQ